MRNPVQLFTAMILLGGFAAHTAAQEGALIIAGGGPMPDAVYDRFLELAGGEAAELVVIPTASAKEPSVGAITELWADRGFSSATVLHTRDRSEADAAGFSDPIDRADAVWMSGGSQRRLAKSYAGGPVEDALKRLVARGGVVGGSSAGAAIQSPTMIARGRRVPKIERGFDLVPGVILDQHFLARNRFNRLLAAVAQHPDQLGVGIEESTAIEVRGGEATVIGESYVVVIGPGKGASPLSISTYGAGEGFSLRVAADE